MNQLAEIQNREVAAQPARIGDLTPMQMAFQLIQSGADINSVREMLAVSKELAADAARRAFDEAVAAAKAEIKPVTKNAKGHNNKAYADFAAYAAAVDPIISRYGLSYRFRTEQTDKITVTCVLSHKEGHSEENSLSGPADASGSKNAIQAIGSSLTYLQRYTLIQALGLAASNDDDGKAAGQTVEDNPISEEQSATIRKLIEDSGTDIVTFCEYLKVEAIPDIPSSRFREVVNMLQRKIEKKRGAK